MAIAMNLTKAGKSSAARDGLIREICAERMTDILVPHFVTQAMQWGLDHQAQAIEEYEIVTGKLVGPERLFMHPQVTNFGATPDGIVNDTVLEIKCPTTEMQLKYLAEKVIPLDYQYQMAAQCLCAQNRKGIFVSFDPRIKKTGRMLILDFSPTDKFLETVLIGAKNLLNEVDNLFDKVTI